MGQLLKNSHKTDKTQFDGQVTSLSNRRNINIYTIHHFPLMVGRKNSNSKLKQHQNSHLYTPVVSKYKIKAAWLITVLYPLHHLDLYQPFLNPPSLHLHLHHHPRTVCKHSD